MSVIDTFSGRICAKIVILREVSAAPSTEALRLLARDAVARGLWTEDVRRRFTARRLCIEGVEIIDTGDDVAAWVAEQNWNSSSRRFGCRTCGRPSFYGRGPQRTCNVCRDLCAHPLEYRVNGFNIARSGVKTPRFVCLVCGALKQSKKDDPRGPHLFEDLRDGRVRKPCERCGLEEGTERHHWAPSAIFGEDAENWPKSDLCVGCHDIWHRQMRRAAGYRLDADERGRDLPPRVRCAECKAVVERPDVTRQTFGGELCPDCAPIRWTVDA